MSILTITAKDIRNVIFPVFGLPKGSVRRKDGLVFWQPERGGEFLLDDKNSPHKVLGLRRLTTHQKHPKQSVKFCYRNFRELLKAKHSTFIDYHGRIFHYEKTKTCSLRYLRIVEVINLKTYSAVKVEGVPKAFEVPVPPTPEIKYAGILFYHEHPWMIYDYSLNERKSSRRKV